ncbi:hypothetical protein A9P82_12210 [Arachidicoccus ginsenosidimutans]|nr:hypothetical protein A9P82_12210 [Arachidicoccus sp. BS20]
MKKITGFIICLIFFAGMFESVHAQSAKTFCNPVDIRYMFQPDGKYRSAADPAMVFYKNKYWLFVSKNDGYYVSDDLVKWKYIKGQGYPTEIFAPAVVVIHDKLYLTTGGGEGAGTFTTDNPASGIWTRVSNPDRGLADPATFLDDDGKLYLYDDCSDKNPIRVTQLDTTTFHSVSPVVDLFKGNPAMHGWEVPGDSSELKNNAPWVEGSWMNKINGKYYLQYAAPGTQYKTYGDGVYVSDKPEGPFTYAPYSPFSFKPTGFVTGTGHSSTFKDRSNNYWHVSTLSISVRHMFERRVGLFPTGVLDDGQLVCNTYLGDYPQYAEMKGENGWKNNLTGWMLLSYDKPAKASSVLGKNDKQNFEVSNAFDENIRTWWSAKSGKSGEWLEVDLQKQCRINAIQVNFADEDDTMQNGFIKDGYGYYVLTSSDGKTWTKIIDHRKDFRDAPHNYTQLNKPVTARYVKIINTYTPAGGKFSLYGFRIFGKAPGKNPEVVKNVVAKLNPKDKREVTVSWKPVSDADFYIIRYGIAPGKLWSNYQVYKTTSYTIRSLNIGMPYYFTVDAVNGHGITKGQNLIRLR